MKFKFEKDNFWWERLRFEDTGVPKKFANKYLNFVLPDKFFHFLSCYGLTMLFSIWFSPWVAVGISSFIMIGLWEIIWDGFFRLGFSWKDLIADLTGVTVALMQLLSPALAIQIYLFIAIKGFLAMWAYSLVKDENRKEIFVILLSLCLIATQGFTGDVSMLKHICFFIGSGICYWWLQNPIIGQDYEEISKEDKT